jgi:hypothetical protein
MRVEISTGSGWYSDMAILFRVGFCCALPTLEAVDGGHKLFISMLTFFRQNR